MKRSRKDEQPQHELPSAGDGRRDVLRFVGRFLVGLALVQVGLAWLPYPEHWAIDNTLESLRVIARLLHLPGGVDGATFRLATARIEIVCECTPLMPALVLGTAMLTYPAAPRARILGVALGALAIWAFNLVRIGTLMAIMVWRPAAFDLVHMYLWQTTTLLVILLLFLTWARHRDPSEAALLRWALIFLLWATPLTWMAVVFYGQYLQFLVGAVVALFGLLGIRVQLFSMDVLAPVDLALFAALALSSTRTPWSGRLGRLALGLVLQVVVEVCLVIVGLVVFLIMALPEGSPGRVLVQNAASLLGWAGAPVVWMLLFGARPFPALAAPTRAPCGSSALPAR